MAYLLHHLLQDSARKFSSRPAVRCKGASIAYAELDDLAGRLAGKLLEDGLVAGDRVGIFMPKSIESVVGIFGALKAGAVYVPIDPLMPVVRAKYILNNCGIERLITNDQMLGNLLADDSAIPCKTYYLLNADSSETNPADSTTVRRREIEACDPPVNPPLRIETDLAYILYTSGSTGAPKGVMISHRAALTFIDWAQNEFSVSEIDVLANIAPLHFDLSVFDIFVAIMTGATVVLVPPEHSTFPAMLTRIVNDYHVTVWYSVPSALTMMLTRGGFEKHNYPTLRLILFAGEVFPIRYFQQLREHTHARLCNLYGPTETNVCTYFDATNVSHDLVDTLPIGKPIANYEVFVLDQAGNPANPGERGELVARGPGLMTGYWGDEEKTGRQLFVSPFESHYGDKCYRTGDIVTQDENGNFVYISRKDNMVKSRGYRIELGEVESALYAHTDVREAAVVAVPDDQITNRIEAYVVTGNSAVTETELVSHCHSLIPKYMVPEVISFRSSLPKTSTGKIDRGALS